MEQIAYLGMGIMGSNMAVNLVRAGYRVMVWNRTEGTDGVKRASDAGATVCETIEKAVRNAGIILSCLGDVKDVDQVLAGDSGVANFARKKSIVVDMTTIGPAAARKVASKLAGKEIEFMDAPVTGGDIGARDATLTIMAGGSESSFERVEPVLKKIGKTVRLCGAVGSGQALKLCNQVLCAVNMIAVSEALLLAERLGVDQALVVDVLSGGAGGSWALSNLGPRILRQDFAPAFALKHMIKDLRLVDENLSSKSNILVGTKLAEALFKSLGEDDETIYGALGTQAMIQAYKMNE